MLTDIKKREGECRFFPDQYLKTEEIREPDRKKKAVWTERSSRRQYTLPSGRFYVER